MKTLMITTAAALIASAASAADLMVVVDADSDGVVTVSEWNAARADTTGVFGEWDTDADNILSRDEFMAGREMQDDADAFGTWDDRYAGWDTDADGMLTQDEYDAGLFDVFDADDDDLWNEEETQAWEEDEMRYDATRSGREISPPDGAGGGGAATQ